MGQTNNIACERKRPFVDDTLISGATQQSYGDMTLPNQHQLFFSFDETRQVFSVVSVCSWLMFGNSWMRKKRREEIRNMSWSQRNTLSAGVSTSTCYISFCSPFGDVLLSVAPRWFARCQLCLLEIFLQSRLRLHCYHVGLLLVRKRWHHLVQSNVRCAFNRNTWLFVNFVNYEFLFVNFLNVI